MLRAVREVRMLPVSTFFRTLLRLWLCVAAALFVAGCKSEPSKGLPDLNANIGDTTVSGISSGAYMAGQFQIAHSRLVTGAAIIAGGPYGCAESVFAGMMPAAGAALYNLSIAVNGCMLNGMRMLGIPDPKLLAIKTRRLADNDHIDPVAGVLNDKIYLFAGAEDKTIVPAIVEAAAQYYAELGVPADRMKHVTAVNAGHAFVTDDSGLACNKSATPYVVDCDYDQAGELLQHFYGLLRPRAAQVSGDYAVFDQVAFTHDLAGHGLSSSGVVYIPASCRTKSGCRIHVAFHGCAQNRDTVGDVFIKDTGLARWADTNDLIVLYPQTAAGATNPQGCWDWWGYSGREYLTRNGPQIEAVFRMLRRLGGSDAAS